MNRRRRSLTVYPLDGTGARLGPIEAVPVSGGYRAHVNADGSQWSPWFEVVE
jgi:hypothetical protein